MLAANALSMAFRKFRTEMPFLKAVSREATASGCSSGRAPASMPWSRAMSANIPDMMPANAAGPGPVTRIIITSLLPEALCKRGVNLVQHRPQGLVVDAVGPFRLNAEALRGPSGLSDARDEDLLAGYAVVAVPAA